MGTITIERWQCDRCHAQHDKRPPSQGDQHEVKIASYGDWPGGTIIDWQELCPECEKQVARIVGQIKADETALRAVVLPPPPHPSPE